MGAQTETELYLDSLVTPVFRKDHKPRYLSGRDARVLWQQKEGLGPEAGVSERLFFRPRAAFGQAGPGAKQDPRMGRQRGLLQGPGASLHPLL